MTNVADPEYSKTAMELGLMWKRAAEKGPMTITELFDFKRVLDQDLASKDFVSDFGSKGNVLKDVYKQIRGDVNDAIKDILLKNNKKAYAHYVRGNNNLSSLMEGYTTCNLEWLKEGEAYHRLLGLLLHQVRQDLLLRGTGFLNC